MEKAEDFYFLKEGKVEKKRKEERDKLEVLIEKRKKRWWNRYVRPYEPTPAQVQESLEFERLLAIAKGEYSEDPL